MYLPAWSKTYAPYWYERVGTRPFLFAVWILALLAFRTYAPGLLTGVVLVLCAPLTLSDGPDHCVFLGSL
jgi:hypothetical protein